MSSILIYAFNKKYMHLTKKYNILLTRTRVFAVICMTRYGDEITLTSKHMNRTCSAFEIIGKMDCFCKNGSNVFNRLTY